MINDSNFIVSKFGGTSMQNAERMLSSAYVAFRQNAKIIVVSATSGTTNELIELGHLAEKGQEFEFKKIQQKIIDKHTSIAEELAKHLIKYSNNELNQPLNNLSNNSTFESAMDSLNLLFSELSSLSQGIFLLRDCSPKAKDALVSLGERLSSILFVMALKKTYLEHLSQTKRHAVIELLDVREILKTDEHFGKAKPLIQEIQIRAQKFKNEMLNLNKIYVTQGFIGQTMSGSTTTLGRGGSDYSAALVGEAFSASAVEIWTDVAGVATTDPRICPEAQWIPHISFKEMSELATFGAKVLHPATLLPAMRQNIPVLVASSFHPDQPGTWVTKEVETLPLIRAMALRKNQTLITLSTPDMLQTHGFLNQIFKIFNEHKISIDAITTSEISVSVTIDITENLSTQLLSELSAIAEVHYEKNLSLVSLIGNKIITTAGLAHQIFDSIKNINIRMICYGASVHNFCFLVKDEDGHKVIQKLHSKFITPTKEIENANA